MHGDLLGICDLSNALECVVRSHTELAGAFFPQLRQARNLCQAIFDWWYARIMLYDSEFAPDISDGKGASRDDTGFLVSRLSILFSLQAIIVDRMYK